MPSPARLCLLTLLCGACTRVPADVSTPDAAAPPSEDRPSRQAEAKPVPGECEGAELQICADSCHNRDCLEWCAGSSCAATIASLWTCMDEAEQRFAATHPEPKLEFETVVDGDEEYPQPTDASLELQYEYEEAYLEATEQRWDEACNASCVAALPDDESFCVAWRDSYHAWERLTRPKPEVHGVLGSYGGAMGMLGGLSIGTSMWLTGQLAEEYDDRSSALQQMVNRAGWKLKDAESCVPDLDAGGREFTIAVELGPDAELYDAQVIDGAPSAGKCVADQVATALALPVRVAREFPRFEVRVRVKPMADYLGDGMLDSGLGGLEGADWGGGFGGELDGGFGGGVYEGYEGEGATGVGTIGAGSSSGGGLAPIDADEDDD